MNKQLYEPYTTGVKTSKNIPVACSEFAVNNALQTVLYGPDENTIIFDKIKQAVPGTTVGTIDASKQINPGSLWFVLYNDPNMEPNEEGYTPELPEDLYHLIKKAVSFRKHMEVNRKDKDSKYRLVLIESRIHRLARYYKRNAQLPPVWKYDSASASALVA